MRHVLIVEDHPLVAEATVRLLESYSDDIEVTICADAVSTIARLDGISTEWFRIFLDLDVPGAFGLSLAKEVAGRGLAAETCVVSAFERRDFVDEIFSTGFLGYIAKSTPISQFRSALVDVLEGRRSFPPWRTGRRAAPTRLTRRQLEILTLIQAGFSSKEIAAQVHVAEGTVNNIVAAIFHVLEVGTLAHAVSKASALGILDVLPCAEGAEASRYRVTGRR